MNNNIIRELKESDYSSVKEIYEQGIATKNATFETSAPDWEEWDKKYLSNCRFVAEENGSVVGWAALSAVSGRCVYAGVCEVSVYVHKDFNGKGIGRKLLSSLIEASEKNNIWTLQAGIFPENKASIKLHLYLGFREVGRRERIGQMDGIWRDTVLLEKRSNIVGV
ncbi:MAG: N-acetyltransferase family protein [Bacteroidetes bacterium]|jgi:phosphinothricin acetyltransferase|nr:N-acetyltransferase family protein [Bacteroidota bacterium]